MKKFSLAVAIGALLVVKAGAAQDLNWICR